MFMEALAILSRNQRHFRVTRALRPLLLLDTHLMVGARRCATINNLNNFYCYKLKLLAIFFRIIRQIIRCGKYIIDVLLILFFLIALAALISGFYSFTTWYHYLILIWTFAGYYLFADTDPTVSRGTSFRIPLCSPSPLFSLLLSLSWSFSSSLSYPQYFEDLSLSFVSTFITMTTAKWV